MLEETPGSLNQHKLKQCKRQCERWTDLVVGIHGTTTGSQAFGYRRDRIDNHIEDLQYQIESGAGSGTQIHESVTKTDLSSKAATSLVRSGNNLRLKQSLCHDRHVKL